MQYYTATANHNSDKINYSSTDSWEKKSGKKGHYGTILKYAEEKVTWKVTK